MSEQQTQDTPVDIVPEGAETKTATAENAKAKPAPTLYDADAVQEVPFDFVHKAATHLVVFRLGPQLDEDLITFDQDSTTKLRTMKVEGQSGVVEETDTKGAAVDLFDKVALTMSFADRPDEKVPENWKKRKMITRQLKSNVITGAYLATSVMKTPRATAEDEIDWDDAGGYGVVTLAALFNGVQVLLTHEFKEASESDHDLAEHIRTQTVFVTGTRVGKADRVVPPTWRRLGALYDRLIANTKGYVGRTPLHHKVAAINNYLSSENEAVEKN
jgi:hypothetical protein